MVSTHDESHFSMSLNSFLSKLSRSNVELQEFLEINSEPNRVVGLYPMPCPSLVKLYRETPFSRNKVM